MHGPGPANAQKCSRQQQLVGGGARELWRNQRWRRPVNDRFPSETARVALQPRCYNLVDENPRTPKRNGSAPFLLDFSLQADVKTSEPSLPQKQVVLQP